MKDGGMHRMHATVRSASGPRARVFLWAFL